MSDEKEPTTDQLLQLLRVLVNQVPAQCAAQVADVLRDGTLWHRATSPFLTREQLAARWSVSLFKVREAWPFLERVNLGESSQRATLVSVQAFEQARLIPAVGSRPPRSRSLGRVLPKPGPEAMKGGGQIRIIQPRTKPRPPE